MTKDFLKLMKKIAEPYGIKIVENAPKGGVFYRDESKNLIEVSDFENLLIIDDFCTPTGINLEITKTDYLIHDSVNWAA